MYPVALNYTKNTQKHIKSLLKASPHTKNSFKTSDYATSRFQTIEKQNVVLPPGSKSFTNKLKRNLCVANCKHRARWTSRHGISSPPLGHKARNELAGFKPSYSSSMRTDIWHKYLSTSVRSCPSKLDSNEPCSHSLKNTLLSIAQCLLELDSSSACRL